VRAMVRLSKSPVWINLEYLSAEEWIVECHGLSSPQPDSSLKKYFFFPGFVPGTGGVLKERSLEHRRISFDSRARSEFLQRLGLPDRRDDELWISLFSYKNPAIGPLLDCWSRAHEQIHLIVPTGTAIDDIRQWISTAQGSQDLHSNSISIEIGSLTIHQIPFLSQSDYDCLLWSCDVNFVRGEDSFVRAQWARKPFVWQIYPQSNDAHQVKLDAFLNRYLKGLSCQFVVRELWKAWNGSPVISTRWDNFRSFRGLLTEHAEDWAIQLDRVGNLVDNLVSFVESHV
jgi:uncharacterized repeat protein (TIGR03837 family)